MKKLALLFTVILFSVCAFAQVEKYIPERSSPPRLVNDLARLLSPDQVQYLESKLVAYDDSTSNQIAIVTIPTTGDYAIEDYALAILRKWGVGNKKTNNGVIILAAINDRKVRIETGYGLEGAIPDAIANQIIQTKIVPNFRGADADNYYRGFDQAIDDLIKAARGEYKAPAGYAQRGQRRGSREGGGSILGFIVLVIILILVFSRRGGGGGGGMFSRRGYGPGPLWGGFLGGMLGSSLGRDSDRGGGGGWSGGGGGFGGFGGGSGGGGGASGSW